jgi:hypothetical protein
VHERVAAFYARRAREGKQILQHYTSTSVETIRGHSRHTAGWCLGRTGVPPALLASPEMKGMIGERFHASGLSAP